MLLLAVLLKCNESNRRIRRRVDPVMSARTDRVRRHSTSVLVDCPGKGALPAIGDSGPINELALTHCAVVGSD